MKRFLLLFLLIIGCKQEEEKKINIPRGSEFTKGFTVYESISGDRKWFLKADSAITEKDRIRIYGVHLKFLDREDVHSVLTSDSGFVIEKTGDLIAYGNVEVLTKDSVKLFTNSLFWDNGNEKILVQGVFHYTGKDEEFEGEGLESDPDLKHIVIKKRVEGKGSIEE